MKSLFFSLLICLLALKAKSEFAYEENLKYKDAPNEYLNQCSEKGKIVTEKYTGINGANSLMVYLPVGYDETKQYNILYLMHGGGENESTIFGKDVDLQNILDGLIKNKDMEPMIVVTPTFNKCDATTFYKELRESVIPFVEGKYKTYAESTSEEDIKASRRHRAYGGFSLGSISTWAVLKNCLDIIAYYMPLSGGEQIGGDPVQKCDRVVSAIKKFEDLTPRDYFIFSATGTNDGAYEGTNGQIEEMKKHTDLFTFTSDFSKGNLYFILGPSKEHWWGHVKHYIYLILPYFFHE